MIVGDLLGWWYTEGLAGFCRGLIQKIRGALSFFSIGQLVRTLFKPFRQISADAQGESLEARFHAFGDRLMSRCVGAVVRLFLMIFGLVVFLLEVVVGCVLAVGWVAMPVLPFVGIILAILGVAL